MKPSWFAEEQIIGILREQEAGAKTGAVCRRHGISSATFYKWKSKYGGLEVSDARQMKGLEDENAKLKKLLAEATLGLVPWERTTGDTVRRSSNTKTGNHRARRVLIEGAWTYRFSARISETLRGRLKGLPLNIRSIAWKAQVRLCARYRRLIASGKKTPVATRAIARELSAFLWAIGQQVASARRPPKGL
jgi:transposase